ncbi:type III pantothenate kinase [Caminibacter mediatlanticus TB-2]|uniref:Type III pantothenate kinase n=1 Tax=Caminibacter mediatlanticus TB-2 TaxID=391592 RepID=A0ABX5V7U7_9BACT|nr:type III pantothenate kinase [Caminibacter mediatlanticus]QCT94306.1 type III pantothenate kinase [Caminibacter mediatlanticus TB-2]
MEDFLVLVDIGNSFFHIYKNGEIYNLKEPKKFSEDVFYISVNQKKEKEFLELNKNAINLEKYVKFDTSYVGLGIDRIMACKTIKDGVVVDAGSAITIDIMQNSIHLGGVIMPGIRGFREAFVKISKKLNYNFCEVDFNKLPHNTQEAISYGSIGAIILMIKNLKKDKKVYLTGGDGRFLSRFVDGIYIKDLVFRGMIKTIKEDL